MLKTDVTVPSILHSNLPINDHFRSGVLIWHFALDFLADWNLICLHFTKYTRYCHEHHIYWLSDIVFVLIWSSCICRMYMQGQAIWMRAERGKVEGTSEGLRWNKRKEKNRGMWRKCRMNRIRRGGGEQRGRVILVETEKKGSNIFAAKRMERQKQK